MQAHLLAGKASDKRHGAHLASARGFGDDILHLDLVVPEFVRGPVQPFIPRVQDLARALPQWQSQAMA